MSERGPLYGVELIDSLPLSTDPGGMTQAMPGREELQQVAKRNPRVTAGYEVLLRHYQLAIAEVERLKHAASTNG